MVIHPILTYIPRRCVIYIVIVSLTVLKQLVYCSDSDTVSALVFRHVSSNHLSHLSPDVFSGLSHLGQLRLDYNEFRDVPCEALQAAPSLKEVTLASNKIRVIPAHCFSTMTSLAVL